MQQSVESSTILVHPSCTLIGASWLTDRGGGRGFVLARLLPSLVLPPKCQSWLPPMTTAKSSNDRGAQLGCLMLYIFLRSRWGKGPYLYDVRKYFGNLDSLPLVHICY